MIEDVFYYKEDMLRKNLKLRKRSYVRKKYIP